MFRQGKITASALDLHNIGIEAGSELGKIWEREVSATVAEVFNNIVEDLGDFRLEGGGESLAFCMFIDEGDDENNPRWTINLSEFFLMEAEAMDNPLKVADALESIAATIRRNAL